MASIKTFKIPLDKQGNLLEYAPEWEQNEIQWADNKVFTDTLAYDGFSKFGKFSYLIFKSTSNNSKYPMFLTDFGRVMQERVIENGRVSGYWTFVRRGDNYGVKLAED